MNRRRATRTSWHNQPLPEANKVLNLRRTFNKREWARIKRGVIPEQMEDKWFIFLEDNNLYFHRSWTGVCIYAVRFEQQDGLFSIASVVVNRDVEQYSETSDEFDAAMLSWLIDVLLLGREAEFPSHPDENDAGTAALKTWSLAGPSGLAGKKSERTPDL